MKKILMGTVAALLFATPAMADFHDDLFDGFKKKPMNSQGLEATWRILDLEIRWSMKVVA